MLKYISNVQQWRMLNNVKKSSNVKNVKKYLNFFKCEDFLVILKNLQKWRNTQNLYKPFSSNKLETGTNTLENHHGWTHQQTCDWWHHVKVSLDSQMYFQCNRNFTQNKPTKYKKNTFTYLPMLFPTHVVLKLK